MSPLFGNTTFRCSAAAAAADLNPRFFGQIRVANLPKQVRLNRDRNFCNAHELVIPLVIPRCQSILQFDRQNSAFLLKGAELLGHLLNLTDEYFKIGKARCRTCRSRTRILPARLGPWHKRQFQRFVGAAAYASLYYRKRQRKRHA
jgi:hypothetical protein